ESTFTRIQDMIPHSKWSQIPGLSLLITQPFDSLSAIGKIQNPLLILHGTHDRIVPHAMSDALFQASANSGSVLRQLVQIDGGSHSNSGAHHEYQSAVRQCIDKAGALARH